MGSEAAAKAVPSWQDEKDYAQFRRDLMDRVVARKILAHIRDCGVIDCGLRHVESIHHDENLWSACRLSRKTAHSSVIYRILRYIDQSRIDDDYAYDHIQGNVSIRGMPTFSVDKVRKIVFRVTQ